MNRKKAIAWAAAGAAILIGAAITIRDYRAWQHAEMDKYGQGYADSRADALPLPNLYENQWAGARIRYPEGWVATEERTQTSPLDTFELAAPWEKQIEIAKWGEMMTMSATKTKETLPDTVVAEISRIKKTGKMLRDGEGLQLDTAEEGRILTWEATSSGEPLIYQEAVAKRGNKVYRVKCKTNKSDWGKWEKTWLAIFKSQVLF